MESYDIAGALRILMRRWDIQGIKLLPPEPREAVVTAFAHVGSRATTDVIQLYSLVGGMDDMDEAYLAIWPLKQLTAQGKLHAEPGPAFADYLISSWEFRIQPLDEYRSAVYLDTCGGGYRQVAPTLAQWLSEYANDPEAPHGW